jgi:nucleoside phosphorylase
MQCVDGPDPPYRCDLSTPRGRRGYDEQVGDSTRLAIALLALTLAVPASAGSRRNLCGAVGSGNGKARVGVLSAFPAELAAVLAYATVSETMVVDGRSFYLGTLAGVRVVMAMTGIGPVNATNTTQSLIDTFKPRAIVFSGVAGTPGRIGDVAVAERWAYSDTEGGPWDCNTALLALARTATGDAVLDQCTNVTDVGEVCMPHTCEVTVGGEGRTSDPFNGSAVPCNPEGNDISGCDVPGAPAAAAALPAGTEGPEPQYDFVVDQETAAVAQLASDATIPFVAYRGASDGAGDPLGLPGFPTQFFAYYRLAAINAAKATTAFLARLTALEDEQPRICKLLRKRRWDKAAERILSAAE